jgi:hypothetical protein
VVDVVTEEDYYREAVAQSSVVTTATGNPRAA